MNCPTENTDSFDFVLDYCAGKLPELKAEAFERHMQACTECRDFVRAQREVSIALDDWKEQPISTDFDRRLYERIGQGGSARLSWRQWFSHKAGWRPALSAGALCAAAAVILLLQAPPEREYDPAAVIPTVENSRIDTIEPEQVENALDDLEMLRQLSGLNNQSL